MYYGKVPRITHMIRFKPRTSVEVHNSTFCTLFWGVVKNSSCLHTSGRIYSPYYLSVALLPTVSWTSSKGQYIWKTGTLFFGLGPLSLNFPAKRDQQNLFWSVIVCSNPLIVYQQSNAYFWSYNRMKVVKNVNPTLIFVALMFTESIKIDLTQYVFLWEFYIVKDYFS